MVWVWKDLKHHLIQPACHGQKYPPVEFRAASELSLDTSRMEQHRRARRAAGAEQALGQLGRPQPRSAVSRQHSRLEQPARRRSRRRQVAPPPLGTAGRARPGPPRLRAAAEGLGDIPGTQGLRGTPRAHGDPGHTLAHRDPKGHSGHRSYPATPHLAVRQGASAKPAAGCTLTSGQDKLWKISLESL